MTTEQIRKEGYEITRGDYHGTSDNNARRWYIQPSRGRLRRGRGYPTRKDAVSALEDLLSLAQI